MNPTAPKLAARPDTATFRGRRPSAGVERAAMLNDRALRSWSRTCTGSFNPRRLELLARAAQRQADSTPGALPDFLPETRGHPRGDWRVAPVPADLQDRRVEITGPVDRKMIINALNSGRGRFMADFEDSNAPTWENIVAGPG